MDLKGIIIGEISETKKDQNHMVSPIGRRSTKKEREKQTNKIKNKLIDTINRLAVTRGVREWEEGKGQTGSHG